MNFFIKIHFFVRIVEKFTRHKLGENDKFLRHRGTFKRQTNRGFFGD